MFKVDCFASGKNGVCTATRRKSCNGCGFYKTREQFRAAFLKSKQRLDDIGYLDKAIDKYQLFGETCAKIGG